MSINTNTKGSKSKAAATGSADAAGVVLDGEVVIDGIDGDDQGDSADQGAGADNLPATRGPASDRQDLAEISPASQEVMHNLFKWLDANRSHTADAEAAQADIIAQVMSAESVDEVLADVTAASLSDWLDKPIKIWEGKFNRSEFEAGLPWYAVLDIEDLTTGKRHVCTTGAQTILAQLIRTAQLDGFPLACIPVYATKKPTARGYKPMRLKPITIA